MTIPANGKNCLPVPHASRQVFTASEAVSLSACLIVRNEAHCLARCLDSLVGVADEIILVDTGSTDQTVEIARQYTDKIFYHAWNDHFSEARNVALAQATGDWVLIIDADEVVPAETARLIPTYLNRPDFQNRPLVLNWRVCSDHHPDLYSRGLFPNHHGIRFAGRVHEIPVLPGQQLPTYHCQDLVLRHDSPGTQDVAKQMYYQSLMLRGLAEACDAAEINHLQKHLGLSHLAMKQWQVAWDMLSACYHGMQDLGIAPQDGFYGEVLRGLVLAGSKLGLPKTHGYALEMQRHYPLEPIAWPVRSGARHPWRKGAIALTMSVLAACQPASTLPHSTSPKPAEHQSMGANPNNLLLPRQTNGADFRIQAAYFCPSQSNKVFNCYASGGDPVIGESSLDANGKSCYIFDHCDIPCELTNTCSCEHTGACETPPPPNEEECIEEPGGEPCVILPPGGGGDDGETDDCEDAPLLLPEDIAPLMQDIQQIQPVQPQVLNRHEKLLEQMKALEAQLAAEGVQVSPPEPLILPAPLPPQGFQTQSTTQSGTLSKKAQKWLAKYEELQTEHAQHRAAIEQTMQGINAPLESLLQRITDTFEIDYTQPETEPNFSLEDYKSSLDIAIGNIQAWLAEENTYSQAAAAANYGNLVLLYHQLYRDILAGKQLAASQPLPESEPFAYFYEEVAQIQDQRALANFMARKLESLQARIQTKQQKLSAATEALIAEAESISQQLDAFELELTQLEADLAEGEGGFSTQAAADGPFVRDGASGTNGALAGYNFPAQGVGSRSTRTPSSRAQGVKQTSNSNVSRSVQQLQRAETAWRASISQRQMAQKNRNQAVKQVDVYRGKPNYNPDVLANLQARADAALADLNAALANEGAANAVRQQAKANAKNASSNVSKVESSCRDENCFKRKDYRGHQLKYDIKEGLDQDWRDRDFLNEDQALSTALDAAFKEIHDRTGLVRSQFKPTAWVRDQRTGKTHPTIFEGPGGANVNIDRPHVDKSWSPGKEWQSGPDAPHVGWQTSGKKTQIKGHIILRDLPYFRPLRGERD